jgi:peptidoglycan/xylan/chitin deacetylase (PgdA/CDA1 family)
MVSGLDKKTTLYFFQPVRRILNLNSTYRIPILMYHSVSEKNDDDRPAYYRQNTHPEIFDKHMKLLVNNGYTTIDLSHLINSSMDLTECKKKYVILTFDDGFENFYSYAYPILQKYGLTATVFIITSKVGKEFKGRRCMNWQQIRELRKLKITFGSHTVTHPELYSLTDSEIEAELSVSKTTLESNLGCNIEHFAYPYAFPENDQDYVCQIEDMLHEIGYRSCLTTIIGRADIMGGYLFKRLPMNSTDDPKIFMAKLNGAYDWLRILQYATKTLKKRRTKN